MEEASTKRDIRKLKLEELKAFFVEHGEKPFRAQQAYDWLWIKSAKSFDQMTNLSLETREMMKKHFVINQTGGALESDFRLFQMHAASDSALSSRI